MSAVMRSDIAHPTTVRVHRSMTVARYSHPWPVLRCVMSPTSLVQGTAAVKSRLIRSGLDGAPSSGTVVLFLELGATPRMPSSRISLRTRYSVARSCSAGSIARSILAPNVRSDSTHSRLTHSRSPDHGSSASPLASQS